MSSGAGTNKAGKEKGSNIVFILRLAIYVILIAGLAGGFNFLHSNTKYLQYTKTVDLNEVVKQGQAFPEGKFVSYKVYFPVGCYAESTSTMTVGSSGSGTGFQTGKDYYYLVILEDYTLMSVKVANEKDVAELDRLMEAIDQRSDIDDFSTLTDYLELTGKLDTLTNLEIKGYCKDMAGLLGVDSESQDLRMYVLDTTAVPGSSIMLIVGAIAGIIVLIVIIIKTRKKSGQAAVQADKLERQRQADSALQQAREQRRQWEEEHARQQAEEQRRQWEEEHARQQAEEQRRQWEAERARQQEAERARQLAEEQQRQRERNMDNTLSGTGFSSSFENPEKWNNWKDAGDL